MTNKKLCSYKNFTLRPLVLKEQLNTIPYSCSTPQHLHGMGELQCGNHLHIISIYKKNVTVFIIFCDIMVLPRAPIHWGYPRTLNSFTKLLIFSVVKGKLFKYIGAKTLQTSAQNSKRMTHTVDFPTPNIFAIVRYSAEEPNAYKLIATLFSNGIASRIFVSLLFRPCNNSHNFWKVLRFILKFFLKKELSDFWQSISQKF